MISATALLGILGVRAADAHPLDMAVVRVIETRVPAAATPATDVRVITSISGPERGPGELHAAFDPPCAASHRPSPAPWIEGAERVEQAAFLCEGGLAGRTLTIGGAEGKGLEIFVTIARPDAGEARVSLDDDRRALAIEEAPSVVASLRSFFALGARHVGTGPDHLVFVVLLAWIGRSIRRTAWAVTAFTIGHGLTLSAATLGLFAVRQAPAEVCIALSIVLVARHVARPKIPAFVPERPSLLDRSPAIVALASGLLHGMGFATALHEQGLGDHPVALALLGFNLGVETAQLGVVLGALALSFLLARVGRTGLLRGLAWGAGAWAVLLTFQRFGAL